MKYIDNCPTDKWNEYVSLQSRAHFLQLSAYGDVRELIGWTAQRPVILDENENILAGFQILIKKTGNGVTIGYIPPTGPYCESESTWEYLLQSFISSSKGIIDLIKWEPGLFKNGEKIPNFEQLGFQPSENTIQPPRTMLIDLSKTEEELIASMNRRARRYIKLSFESNLVFRAGDSNDARVLASYIVETFNRKGLQPYPNEYYYSFFDKYANLNRVSLFVADYEGNVISGRMLFPIGDTVFSVWGASSGHYNDLQPNYGLEWYSIKWAKNHGYKYLDFWGIPDFEISILEENFRVRRDGLWGVYEFKRGFSGDNYRAVGAYDLHLSK